LRNDGRRRGLGGFFSHQAQEARPGFRQATDGPLLSGVDDAQPAERSGKQIGDECTLDLIPRLEA
jgi:hypothetical protein